MMIMFSKYKMDFQVNSVFLTWLFFFSIFISNVCLSSTLHINGFADKILYVIEYKGIDGIEIKSDSNQKPELTRVFKNGDKARWYLTESELQSITYLINDNEHREWYTLEKSNTGKDWITITLKPSFRYDKIELIPSTNLFSCTVTSNETRFWMKNEGVPPQYPPNDNWSNTKEVTIGQHVFLLANDNPESDGINLKIELPWGFESKDGERSLILNLSTLPDINNQVKLEISRLPIIPLIYINYAEPLQSSSIRPIQNALKGIKGKVFISLGHDGQLVFKEEVFSSRPESWNRLNQFINRHPTIGYASIPRNEIRHFVKRVDNIEYRFWDNHVALPILIFTAQNFRKQETEEITQWIQSIDNLSKNRLIKKEFVIIQIDGDLSEEKTMQIENYTIYQFNWRTSEIKHNFTRLLNNLSIGTVL